MKVEFPQYINRSRLLFIFEMDMIIILISVFIGIFWILSKAFPTYISLPLSIYFAYRTIKLYAKAKYVKAPGFIRHFFYNLGMYKIDLDEDVYEELKYRDSKTFYPSGYVRNFRD